MICTEPRNHPRKDNPWIVCILPPQAPLDLLSHSDHASIHPLTTKENKAMEHYIAQALQQRYIALLHLQGPSSYESRKGVFVSA